MRIALPLLAAALLMPPLAAQTPAPPAPTAAPEPTYVVEKGFKSKVFEVKHREAHLLCDSVRALGSGVRGASITANNDLSTVTVRDFPENVASVEEALKRLDTPEARHPDVQIRLYVLIATPFPQSGPVPDELKDVIPALRSTLAYKGFESSATFEQRVKDGTRDVEGAGVGTSPGSGSGSAPLQIDYRIKKVLADNPGTGPATVRLDGFSFRAVPVTANGKEAGENPGRAAISTDLSVKDGEKVVVGTSALKDRGLIVVLVASVKK